MINPQAIVCPVCRHPIPFDTTRLLQGDGFACPNCRSVVSVAPESIEQTKEAVEQFERLKQTMGKAGR